LREFNALENSIKLMFSAIINASEHGAKRVVDDSIWAFFLSKNCAKILVGLVLTSRLQKFERFPIYQLCFGMNHLERKCSECHVLASCHKKY